jgi:hypothetical protein
MAKFTSVNQLPATGAAAVYSFKQCLVSAGWVVKASSDGTTYNSTGDQITDATKLAAANAWVRLQDPGTHREFCLQRTTNNTLWRVKYSLSAKFTGGSPGATRVPSAADEATILGGGTDAAPTGATLFPTDNTYRCHTIAFSDTVASGGASAAVYSFFFFVTANGTGANTTKFFCDGLGYAHPLDADTAVIMLVATTVAANTFVNTPIPSWIWAWCRPGLSGGAFTNWMLTCLPLSDAGATTVLPPYFATDCGPSGYGGEDVVKLVGLFRTTTDSATNYGFKGFCSRLAYNTTWGRTYPSTHSLTTDAGCWVDDNFVVPWENNTAPAL